MSRPTLRRNIFYAAGLAVGWVMLWDKVSVGNVLGGLLVATVLLAMFPLRPVDDRDRLTFRPLAFARLAAAIVGELVVSNVLVSREIVTREDKLRTGIVACRMGTSSPKLLSMIANLLALSPGTMAVEATMSGAGDSPPTLYVHVLSLDDIGDVRRRVARIERLVIDAMGRRPATRTDSPTARSESS